MMAEEIKKLFPKLYGQPSARLVDCNPKACTLMENKSLKIGVVLSGGQAPGGHNVIAGIFGRGFCFWPFLSLYVYKSKGRFGNRNFENVLFCFRGLRLFAGTHKRKQALWVQGRSSRNHEV